MPRNTLDAAALQALTRQHNGDMIAALQTLLPEAAALAVAPISNFYVGAIAIDDLGHAWFGANQEFAGAAFGQTIHAEQSAIAHAWMGGATQLAHIVITHTPCGHCRQFMSELQGAEYLRIHLPQRRDILLDEYLPQRFGPVDLNIAHGLLHPIRHNITATVGDELAVLALEAAQQSHAPYSRAHAGFALRTGDGRVFCGRYAENAAFNPTLPALQCALNMLHIHGGRAADIAEGVLVYQAGAGHDAQTRLLWHAVTDAPLRMIVAEKAV